MVADGEIVVLFLLNCGQDWTVSSEVSKLPPSSLKGGLELKVNVGTGMPVAKRWRCIDEKPLRSVTSTTLEVLRRAIDELRGALVSPTKQTLTRQEAEGIIKEIIARFEVKPSN